MAQGQIGCGGGCGGGASSPAVDDPFPWLRAPRAPQTAYGATTRGYCISRRLLLDAVALTALVWLISELA